MAPAAKTDQGREGERGTEARSSRKLSGERLARKRELDRQAQHDARRKTKSYIAHLESLVESLKKTNSSDRDPWIAQIEEKRKLNEQLGSTLRTIGRMAEATLKAADLESPVTIKTNENEESNSTEDAISPGKSPDMIECLGSMNAAPATSHRGSQNEIPLESPNHVQFYPNTFACQTQQRHNSMENSLLKNSTVSRIHHHCDPPWTVTKQIMQQVKTIRNYPIVPEAADAEIPVQAILLGWDIVERMYTLNPLWQILRQTDTGIFFSCVPHLRLAAMILMHMEMKYLIDPSDENLEALPVFLRPRPCQKFMEYPTAIDFFPWPGLREQLVFCEHDFCMDRFSRAYLDNYKFRWPFEFRDTYVKNQDTGMLELSRAFLERVHDLQSWTMAAPLFEAFPQLRGDIPMWTPVSNPLNPTFSTQPPSVSLHNYEISQMPIHSRQESQSQMQEPFDTGGNGVSNTATSDQSFMTPNAGLFWGEVLQ